MSTQEYLDFVLRVDKGSGSSYPVSVLFSPAGEASGAMELPVLSDEWQSRLSIVANARGGSSRSPNAAPRQADPLGLSYTKRMGQDLCGALINGPVRSCFETSLHLAKAENKGLRIKLRIQAPELAALPWEYLTDADHGPLTLSKQTPIVRHMEMGKAVEKPKKLQPPIRILGMIGDHRNLDVAAEQRVIEEAIDNLGESGTIELKWVSGHTWRDLQSALENGKYHVFHFIGHGKFDERSGMGKILLAGDGGESYGMDASDLGRLLADHGSICVAVLNSCEGAKSSQTNLFSSTGSVLASCGLPAVISMQYEISDGAAKEFSRAFYDSLANGNPVEAAVASARMGIKMYGENTVEWGTPVLHLRAKDGLLFELDVAGAVGLTKQTAPPPPAAASSPAPPVAGPSRAAQLAALATRVKTFWVDSVLEKKLEQTARLDLGLELMAGEVISVYGADESLQALSPGQVFSELGNLLILGEPGSGKTVALLELARDLLRESLGGVPVVFNLSSWAARKSSLSEWMVEELRLRYQVPKALAKRWIEEKQLLPLLDGLDEVAGPARGDCVRTINEWLSSSHSTGIVVCCRFKEYRELPEKLALNGAVRLRALTSEQVVAFVEQAGPQLAALRTLVERDSGMLIDARCPLMLGLMARAYRGVDAGAAEFRSGEGIAARRARVMGDYVNRELQRAREGGALV